MNKNKQGFTLLETLTVVSVMAILMATALPAINSMSNSTGRQGAVNTLLNAFEQARIAALTNGVNAYVGFADQSLSQLGTDFPYHAYIIFRDRVDSDPAGVQYVAVTKWMFLPKNISFKRDCTSLFQDGTAVLSIPSGNLPQLNSGASLPSIVYTPTGAIRTPSNPANLCLYLYEGVFANNRDTLMTKNSTYFDRITFQRFTGRAEMDLATLQ
ncbi:MAG: prepilin-type N-terminal cleavage/methylation domain-containing protein [Verrucomicrobiales bacterium]|jgi:prepilin-type N-terminal cleavage/methylation domain-containing protein|nr:prepilin-type N-terminal cleavage/methylation domain-containing protein [Verrucomicrobiales bacterium]